MVGGSRNRKVVGQSSNTGKRKSQHTIHGLIRIRVFQRHHERERSNIRDQECKKKKTKYASGEVVHHLKKNTNWETPRHVFACLRESYPGEAHSFGAVARFAVRTAAMPGRSSGCYPMARDDERAS